MAENPPLNRIYVLGYSANDRDYPIVSLNADPRVAGYRVPEDLSTCPDKRYPNHVFTGAQPISGDERVRHVWELLPSPYVPFTRYDDDLGPVQGRRRSVKNEGQVASRETDKQTTYDAREGSAIVYTELEETWSIATDDDGNSLFPIRDRDFYDPSRGPVQERRQILVPTGEEEGSLENVNGVITQTSYEPYNDFLSVKVVQTYSVDGPQLVGNATDNDGQLVTVTTQRKAANGYAPPSPTATRTVEVNREDTESLVERVVDTPQVFGADIYRKTREDLTPQKFKAAQEDSTVEQNIAGTADPNISLATGEFAKSEQQVNKFVKRVSATSRSTTVSPAPLVESVLTNEGQIGTRTLTLASGGQSFTPSATLVDANVEALGDGRTVKTEVKVPRVFANKTISKTKIDLTPEKFKAKQEDTTTEESVAGTVATNLSLNAGQFRKSEQQVTEFIKRTSTTSRDTTATTGLEEFVITPQGQLATRTLKLSSEKQTIQPEAKLIDGSIEELGDGRTVKTEVRVKGVFDGKVLSASKPDTIPEKFRANAQTQRTEEVVEGTSATSPSLNNNQYSKTEQRLTEFTVQKTTIERADTLNQTNNQRLEENWGIQIPYKEYISSSIPSGDNYEAEGLDDRNHLVREYNKQDLDTTLSSFSVTIPTSIDLDLPRILKDIKIEWQEEKSFSKNDTVTTGAMGAFRNLTQQDDGEVSSNLTLIPKVEVEFEDIWGKNLPATINLFFLKKSELNESQIKSKTGASQVWPIFKPKSYVKSIFGKSEYKRLRAYVSRAIEANSTDAGYGYQPTKGTKEDTTISLNPVFLNIPPCLTKQFLINEPKTLDNDTFKIELNYEQLELRTDNGDSFTLPEVDIDQELDHSIDCEASITIPATTPSDVPRSGIYLISSSAEPYKFGWFLVRAISFDAAILE